MTPANPSPVPAMVACGLTLAALLGLGQTPRAAPLPLALPAKPGWSQAIALNRWEYRQRQTVVTLEYVPHSDGDALALLDPTGDRPPLARLATRSAKMPFWPPPASVPGAKVPPAAIGCGKTGIAMT